MGARRSGNARAILPPTCEFVWFGRRVGLVLVSCLCVGRPSREKPRARGFSRRRRGRAVRARRQGDSLRSRRAGCTFSGCLFFCARACAGSPAREKLRASAGLLPTLVRPALCPARAGGRIRPVARLLCRLCAQRFFGFSRGLAPERRRREKLGRAHGRLSGEGLSGASPLAAKDATR